MRKLSFIIFSSAALLLLIAGPAYGQWTKLKGQIPFDFSVTNKILPADTYTVNKLDRNVLVIRSETKGAFLFAVPVSLSVAEPQFIFRRYGDQYFLTEVRGDTIFRLPKSEKERQVSLNYPEPELVYVALK